MNVGIYLAASLLLQSSVAALHCWRKPNLLWNPSTSLLDVSAFKGAFLLAIVLGFVGGTTVYGL